MEILDIQYDRCVDYLREIVYDNESGEDIAKIRWLASFIHNTDPISTADAVPGCVKNKELLILTLDALTKGSLAQDSQVLLSTALCVLVKNCFEQNEASVLLGECVTTSEVLKLELGSSREPFEYVSSVQYVNFFRLCLSCAILQYFRVESLKDFYYLSPTGDEDCRILPFAILFDLLEELCQEFTNLTYLSFKILVLWLTRLDDLYRSKLIKDLALVCCLKRILYIVCQNWENTAVGVRDKNVEVMKLLLGFLTKINFTMDISNEPVNLHYLLAATVLEIPWRMKYKYLMLLSILPMFGIREALGIYPNISKGLVFSLSHPHLVSSGTDVYQNFLRVLDVDEWLKVFYCSLREVMLGDNKVAKKNLMSYWMPPTIKAYPSVIHEIVCDLSSHSNASSLFPLLSMLRIGRKGGILKWEHIDHGLLRNCVSHTCEEVRAQVFATVCVCAQTTSCVRRDEIDIVCTFLEENINGDCSRLRQNVITYFKTFFIRIKNCLATNEEVSHEAKHEIETLIGFLEWLKKFIVDNLVPGVNYQRKIGSLCLLRIVLDSNSSEIPSVTRGKKSGPHRSVHNLCQNGIDLRFKGNDMFNILLRCLMDQSSDVRETASLILKMHFVLHSKDLFPCLWGRALSMCNSSMFYVIESGVILAECLVHWLLCERSLSVGEEKFPFIEVLVSLAEEQRVHLEENVLKGAMNSPVHGVINILLKIISSPDVLAELEMQEAHLNRLMKLVDGMITFSLGVLSSKPSSMLDVAPSFAEMGIAIECAVSENAKCSDGELTGATDLVLNCIWLNLKMCCFLVSTLASNLSQGVINSGATLEEDLMGYCGEQLIRVLMKCRHKGVIESAGKALSMFALACTSNPKFKKLPRKLLLECLEHILGKRDGRVSITRRSAGLSILIHKLVAADSKNNIPACVPKLIEWAEVDCLPECSNYETEDLPQTQALHFLRILVQDSGVHQYISTFMSKIILICFKNFSSGVWSIRNASLQLFGAVVPKLVGQKKGQEEDVVGSNVTVEEMIAHYPDLMNFLLQELSKSVENLASKPHVMAPSLLPGLMLCSRLTVGIPQLHTDSFKATMSLFQSSFIKILQSPNIEVRKSCAKAISAFTALTHLPEKIRTLAEDLTTNRHSSGNELHGKLLCIKTLLGRLEVDSHLMEELTKKFKETLRFVKECEWTGKYDKHSYFTRALIDELQDLTQQDINLKVVMEARDCARVSFCPGFDAWIKVSVDLIVASCSEISLNHIIQESFKCCASIQEACLVSLMRRLEKTDLQEKTKLDIFTKLVDSSNSDVSIFIMMLRLNCMLKLSLMSSACISLAELEILYVKFIEKSNYGMGCSSVGVPLISCLIIRVQESDGKNMLMMKIASSVLERCAPTNLEEVRFLAARALSFLIPSIATYHGAIENENTFEFVERKLALTLLESVVLLLQDENVEIRAEAAKCVSNLKAKARHVTVAPEFQLQHPQACIKFLFNNVLELFSQEIALCFLWKHLTSNLEIHDLEKTLHFQTLRNPFDHGIDNIYAEKIIITMLSDHTLKDIIKTNQHSLKVFKSLVLDGKQSILRRAGAILSLTCGELGNNLHVHGEVFHTLVSIKLQLQFASHWVEEGSEDFTSLVPRLEREITKMLNPIQTTSMKSVVQII